MRAFQIFASMSSEQNAALLEKVAESSPITFRSGMAAACEVLKVRPVYLKKQPFEKKASLIRRTLSRVTSNTLAEEFFAIYFLECRKDLLVEWLDALGLEHEDGTLSDDEPAAPDAGALEKTFREFLARDEDTDRPLLVKAFASQAAIDWPALDALVETEFAE